MHLNQKLELPLLVFYGSKGVGKTTTATALQQYLYTRSLLSLDLTQLTEANLVEAFTKESAQLGVILLLNLENAQPTLLHKLIELAQQGELIDKHGKVHRLHDRLLIFIWNIEPQLKPLMSIAQTIGAKTEAVSLLQLVVNDMPEAEPEPELALTAKLTADFSKLPAEFVQYAEFIPFEKLTSASLEQLIKTYLSKLALQIRTRQGMELNYNGRLPEELIEIFSLEGFSAGQLYSKLDELVLPLISKVLLQAPEEAQRIKLYLNNFNKLDSDLT